MTIINECADPPILKTGIRILSQAWLRLFIVLPVDPGPKL